MKPIVLLRIATVLLGIFLVGHTIGAVATSSRGPEESAVFDAMRAYQFDAMGTARTHWDFYLGFSLFLSANLLLLIVMVIQVTNLAKSNLRAARPFVVALFVGHAIFASLCWIYFFIAPSVFTTAAAVCFGVAAAKMRQE